MARYKRSKKQNKFATIVLSILILAVMFVGGLMLFDNFGNPTPFNQVNVNLQHKRFINKILPESVEMQKKYNILASVSIAQAILESDWGQSKLSKNYNNLYGIKAMPYQKNVKLDTIEYVDNKPISIKGRFRVYDSWNQSVEAHAILLGRGTDWNPQQYKEVVQADNYIDAAKGLTMDGYATDPAYANKIIKIIQKYHLNRYDRK